MTGMPAYLTDANKTANWFFRAVCANRCLRPPKAMKHANNTGNVSARVICLLRKNVGHD